MFVYPKAIYYITLFENTLLDPSMFIQYGKYRLLAKGPVVFKSFQDYIPYKFLRMANQKDLLSLSMNGLDDTWAQHIETLKIFGKLNISIAGNITLSCLHHVKLQVFGLKL